MLETRRSTGYIDLELSDAVSEGYITLQDVKSDSKSCSDHCELTFSGSGATWINIFYSQPGLEFTRSSRQKEPSSLCTIRKNSSKNNKKAVGYVSDLGVFKLQGLGFR